MAAHAQAAGRATPLVRQHPARSLRLLWAAAQLPGAERGLPGGSSHLVPLPSQTQPESSKAHLGRVQRDARTLPSAAASDHTSPDGENGMTRVTLGRSRVRESRTPGSVRAKPNGCATRPSPEVFPSFTPSELCVLLGVIEEAW